MSGCTALDDVVIVGAGVVGLFAALHLKRLGVGQVRVFEARSVGAGASGRSGALIRSNCETEVESLLAMRSLQVFREWRDAIGGENGFVASGLLELAGGRSAAAMRARVARQRAWGVGVELISPEEAATLCSGLSTDGVTSAAFEAAGGYCEPAKALGSLYRATIAAGVNFRFGVGVLGLDVCAGICRGVRTSEGLHKCGSALLVPGAWANSLVEPICHGLGLTPHLSRLAVFAPGEIDSCGASAAVLDHILEAWFRPSSDGGIMVGAEIGGQTGVDPDEFGDEGPSGLARAYAELLARRFRASRWSPCRGVWQGMYMRTPDGLPVVGALPGCQGVYLAGGDNGGAFKLAPALGEAIAELIVLGESRTINISMLSAERLMDRESQRA